MDLFSSRQSQSSICKYQLCTDSNLPDSGKMLTIQTVACARPDFSLFSTFFLLKLNGLQWRYINLRVFKATILEAKIN